MRKVLRKFHLQHELKQNWSREEAMLLEKMVFMDEAKVQQQIEERNRLTAEQPPAKRERSEEAIRAQERITQQINEERLNIKAMREEKV